MYFLQNPYFSCGLLLESEKVKEIELLTHILWSKLQHHLDKCLDQNTIALGSVH